ncbi:MAG: LacI family DNA-binding transcriptional regulator [Pseudomonadota bacterium]
MSNRVGKIRDVARETGFSVATISRVMNGATNVKPTTRDKVLLACEKMDYFPNPAARALSTNRSKSIAAIIPTIEHSVFAKYIDAVEQTLSKRGYSLVLSISNADATEELGAARKLLGMGADAFILSGADHSTELLDLFRRRHIPFVFTSIWNGKSPYPTIGYDNHALAKLAVEYLISKGHQNIAVVHGPLLESDRTRSRKEGALSAQSSNVSIAFFETDLSVSGGKTVVRSIKESGKNFTAILCFSDVIALGVYFRLQELGIAIPDDVSVMGFDNLDWSEFIVPALTTIYLPAAEMGHSVAEALMDHLETKEAMVSSEVPGHIVERQSVANRKSRSL